MRATQFEFRFRFQIITAVIVLGYWAPWIGAWGEGRRVSLLEWLALTISRTGLLSFTAATAVLIVLGSLTALKGAVLRVWGAAYLGYGVVHDSQMHAGAVMADGPYRFLRNPLYWGVWCMVAAMALSMPVSGALVAVPLLSLFSLRLIFGEEAYLAAKLGAPYADYLRRVPRLVPRRGRSLPAAGNKPHWGVAAISELNAIGVFLVVATLSWSYDNLLVVRGILVVFGISLAVRALMPARRA